MSKLATTGLLYSLISEALQEANLAKYRLKKLLKPTGSSFVAFRFSPLKSNFSA
jgi:hypothetical protein